MRPFPHLHAIQDEAVERLSAYTRAAPAAERRLAASELCRLAVMIGQVRDEVVYPFCVGRTPAALLDASMIETDLSRVLVREIMEAAPGEVLFDGFVEVLGGRLRSQWLAEECGGLWDGLSDPDRCDEADVRIGERLADLDRDSLVEGWIPPEPACLETLRNSVPPGATPWSDD